MRLAKLTLAIWIDLNWAKHLRASWNQRGYWLSYQRPKPWVEQASLGPLRLDVKAEGVLKNG